MPRATANVGRVLLGALLLLTAWFVGGFMASRIYPGTELINRMENLAAKIGGSIAILLCSVIIRRYLLRSFGLAMVGLAATETLAFCIIMVVIGLTGFGIEEFGYSVVWLCLLTWNIVVAFLIGAGIGHVWDRRIANKALHATAPTPSRG